MIRWIDLIASVKHLFYPVIPDWASGAALSSHFTPVFCAAVVYSGIIVFYFHYPGILFPALAANSVTQVGASAEMVLELISNYLNTVDLSIRDFYYSRISLIKTENHVPVRDFSYVCQPRRPILLHPKIAPR